MSLLSRLKTVHAVCWRVSKSKILPSSEFCVPPVVNLLDRRIFRDNKSFSTNVDTYELGDDVKRYLNYISELYRNSKLETDENLGAISRMKDFQSVLSNRLEIMSYMESLKDLATDDKEMEELRKEESLQYETKLQNIDNELLDTIINNLDTDTYDRVILEVIAGVGGSEAMIFAFDLFNMYINYLERLDMEHQILECEKTAVNSMRNGSILISDKRGFNFVQYEGGVHRVQRVPTTERHGRIHTSTASVAIFPEPSDVQINILDKDLRVDTMRASGAGGQHVNTTDSAVRIVHLPSGIVVTSQQGRSQLKNKEIAMLKLKTLLYEQQLSEQVNTSTTLRKQQVGKRTRNEKIRTYNYTQDRITDHRSKDWKVGSLKAFMADPTPLAEFQELHHKEMLKRIFLEIVRKSETRSK